jgi:glycosyltransferase involved in cell wall biosynthesis
MLVGIDASRAFLRHRTGIEEYSYQVIRHLRDVIPKGDFVILYVRKKISLSAVIPSLSRNLALMSGRSFDFAQDDKRRKFSFFESPRMDFELPKNWEVKGLWAPRFWTQIRLSLEMLFHPPDTLFVPAHTVPVIHPARNATFLNSGIAQCLRKFFHKFSSCPFEHSVAGGPRKTVVTVHGLEYEMFPKAYSFWERLYMRLSIRFSVRVADRIVAVSENTKRDLMRLYGVPEEKIAVIYEGYSRSDKMQDARCRMQKDAKPYMLFIGRLEERKNAVRIIEAFGILKEKYHIPHELMLAGKPGFGCEKIRFKIRNSKYEIREIGYVNEEEKWELLKNSDVFLFPTLYEGFGLPVLEAQAVGVPVVASKTSSLPEVGGKGALYADPLSPEDIAEQTWKLLSEKDVRDGIIAAGFENVRRFDWKKCSEEITGLLG